MVGGRVELVLLTPTPFSSIVQMAPGFILSAGFPAEATPDPTNPKLVATAKPAVITAARRNIYPSSFSWLSGGRPPSQSSALADLSPGTR
jgi:hypothetical protein